MRNFLIKHILKIAKSFKLKRMTVALAVFYLDKYFSQDSVTDTQGLIIYTQAALFMAMKYEEIYPPDLD